MKNILSTCCLLITCLLSACSFPKPGMIRDLEVLPQNTKIYHGLPENKPLFSTGAQAALYTDFLRKHFGPWDLNRQPIPVDTAFWALTHYADKTLYGQTTLRHPQQWFQTMRRLVQKTHYPSMDRPCITVTNTSMRTFPTFEPFFYDFKKAGEGFPFDYAQSSLVLAGTPVRAMHMSSDGAWVLVESRFAFGWVPVHDVAWVDDAFMGEFNAPGHITLTRDSVPVADDNGQFHFTGHIGTILPLAEQAGRGDFKVLIPVRKANGNAAMRKAAIGSQDAALMPMQPTPTIFAQTADVMLGRPYGWGGLYEGRDCSATLMDLMVGFGIFLPRNSSQQYEMGLITELNGLSRSKKKQIIIEHGIPFLTLLRSPGHIMLYVGHHKNEPIVLQTMWGIKTQFMFGEEGRHVIGRTVVTTLEPGKELINLAPGKGNVLDSVYGMSFIRFGKQGTQ